ncbi:MAG TPA: cache domain-containing protein [Thermodesulfobacteriota bacterium]|nr:cache domain-containing protein [Thermodesulfobacteriota bacterium]
MRILTKERMALLSLAIALFTGVVTGILVNSVISDRVIYETQERIRDALNAARWVYTSKINDIDRMIRLTSLRYVVRNAIKERNPSLIKNDMLSLMAEEKLDFLALVDRNGMVLFRYHNPGSFGDSILKDPFFKHALGEKGVSGTQVLPGEAMLKEGDDLAKKAILQVVPTPKEKPAEKLVETSGMVLKSAYPIADVDGRILGVLMGGVLLNRNYEIVDRIKHIVFKDAKYKGKEIGTATIFLGDLRISTNVLDREGNRAIGTRVMKEVEEQVLEKGLSWIQRAYVVDDWYLTAYEPIRDIQDNIVGILYVGIMERKYVILKERLIFLFMLAMLAAVAVSAFLSLSLLKKTK